MLATIPLVAALWTHGGDAPPERRVRGGSVYVDGQFSAFDMAVPGEALLSSVDEATGEGQPNLYHNATAPLVMGSGCAWPGACGVNGAWVEVSGSCGPPHAESGWWVGLFPASAPTVKAIDPNTLPGNNSKSPWTPPFVLPAPLKFSAVDCSTNLSKPNLNSLWWVPNTRAPLAFVLFSGGTNGPVERARTTPLVFVQPDIPMHLRLARTRSSTEMRVSFTSYCATPSAVHWDATRDPSVLSKTAGTNVSSYTAEDVCGEPAKTMGWWEPHHLHTTVLDLKGLAPGTSVYYQATSSCSGAKSQVARFRVPLGVGPHFALGAVLTADMGATTPDHVSQHWAEGDAFLTTGNMARLVADGFRGQSIDLAFCIGDLSYATGYLGKWETFMNAIEPVSSQVPYMTAQGNHEQDWYGTETIGSGTGPELGRDSGGECGVPTAKRFIMPRRFHTGSSAESTRHWARQPPSNALSDHDSPYWYSFDAGPVHFVIVNTELPIFADTSQYKWLKSDLESVDRMQTPWTVVMGHRPSVFVEKTLAALLFEHQVDLTVAGHVHYAQRSCPLSPFSGCVSAPNATGGFDGIVHVVAGNGGQALNNATKPSTMWPYTGSGCNWTAPGETCMVADKKLKGGTQGSGTEFGFSALTANATALTWSFLGNNESLFKGRNANLFVNHSAVHYTFTLHRAFPRPPPGISPHPPPHPPPPPSPTPNPPAGPNPPGTSWDCHPHTATPGLGLKDTDLTRPPFGTASATAQDCEEMCNGSTGDDCVVINWHGGTVNHCHLLTGPKPTHVAFLQSLKNKTSNPAYTDYMSCMRLPNDW